MSIFSSFTRRNNLIKTLQFKLTPMYDTAEQMEKLGVLVKDKERYACLKTVMEVLARMDAAFVEATLCENANELNWLPLAAAFASVEHSELLRSQQNHMRKKLSEIFTKNNNYKNLVNPSKAIKMAVNFAENSDEEHALALYARFSTVLADYFNHKKLYFSSDLQKHTIAYRLVHDNFPIYLQNLQLLKKLAAFKFDVQKNFSFPCLEINSYNHCLTQRKITDYNNGMTKLNACLRNLKRQNLLPEDFRHTSMKLLYKQILGAENNLVSADFTAYEQVRQYVGSIKEQLEEILCTADVIFSRICELDVQEQYQNRRCCLLEAADKLYFKQYSENSVVSIKKFLDAVLYLRRFLIKIQHTDKKVSCDEALALLKDIPFIYAKTRNYLTRKPYKNAKIRLFFNCAAFGKGWDVNREQSCLLTIFKDGQGYYLGIRRLGAKIDFAQLESEAMSEPCYEKMLYKAFDFAKGMASVVFSKQTLEKFANGAEQVILDNEFFNEPFLVNKSDFAQKYYIKGNEVKEIANDDVPYLKAYYTKTGDLDGYICAVQQRINFAKRFMQAYKSFAFFDMSQLKPTNEYNSWSEFVAHVNEFTYKIRWSKISVAAIQNLIGDGDLFFFKLDNQDFSLKKANNQRENVQTMLLKQLFGELNDIHKVLKLLGNAEVYYRPASQDTKAVYRQGSFLVNKKDTYNRPVEYKLHKEITDYLNGKSISLSAAAAQLLENKTLKYKKIGHDIVKDKRFTENQLFIHFPIAINYRCSNKDYGFNKDFRMLLKENSEINIMSVYYGGENLAYITIISQDGKILYQKAYNQFNQYRYDEAIALREKERKAARRSWRNIQAIKNLKLGFMSALIHEIVCLLEKFNCIIVLEDRRRGFVTRGERSLNQSFVSSLLNKLNYVVYKDKDYLEPGGLLNGYQLCPQVDNLDNFSNQVGCVFFVPLGVAKTGKTEPKLYALCKKMDISNKDAVCAYAVAMMGKLFLQKIKAAANPEKVNFLISEKNWLDFLEEQY